MNVGEYLKDVSLIIITHNATEIKIDVVRAQLNLPILTHMIKEETNILMPYKKHVINMDMNC